jgi:hypothetical protein
MRPLLFLSLLLVLSCKSQSLSKMNGVSFVASREAVSQNHIKPVVDVAANYAAVMPFGFVRSLDHPELVFDSDRQWYGETKEGAKQYIESLNEAGIEVMLKPQIWVWRGEFTGDIEMSSEDDWKAFEQAYRSFAITYAHLAEDNQVPVYCIGTELEEFVLARPEFWAELITDIRKVYKGKLTYAANWDEYGRDPFWEQLDYVGIDAYFPLSDQVNPTEEQLRQGWAKWKEEISALSQKVDKPVIFTEYGYRSMDYTAKKPWLVDRNQEQVNLEAQALATRVLLDEFWQEPWFAGGFVWKWFIHHDRSGGSEDNRFTPQNKPAQAVLQEYYQMYAKE